MDTNAVLHDVLGVSSDSVDKQDATPKEQPVVKERKKPGPKPKSDKAVESNESKIKTQSAESESLEADKKVSQETTSNQENHANGSEFTEPQSNATLKLNSNKLPISYTFANPVVLYRSPSDKLPLCKVSSVRFTGAVTNGYARCFTIISGQGRTYGYVKMNPTILKLLSTNE